MHIDWHILPVVAASKGVSPCTLTESICAPASVSSNIMECRVRKSLQEHKKCKHLLCISQTSWRESQCLYEGAAGGCMLLDGMLICQQWTEKDWEGQAKSPEVLSWHLPRGTEENHKNIRQISQYTGRYLNWACPRYKFRVKKKKLSP
jgi:hypothetical protein